MHEYAIFTHVYSRINVEVYVQKKKKNEVEKERICIEACLCIKNIYRIVFFLYDYNKKKGVKETK